MWIGIRQDDKIKNKQETYINLTCFTFIKASSTIERNRQKDRNTFFFQFCLGLVRIGQILVQCIKTAHNSMCM